jgi:hypothetical protein
MGFKNIDIFGYDVRLNFNQQGSTYKTCCGAVLTLIFYILTLYCFMIMLQSNDHKFGTNTVMNEPRETEVRTSFIDAGFVV